MLSEATQSVHSAVKVYLKKASDTVKFNFHEHIFQNNIFSSSFFHIKFKSFPKKEKQKYCFKSNFQHTYIAKTPINWNKTIIVERRTSLQRPPWGQKKVAVMERWPL